MALYTEEYYALRCPVLVWPPEGGAALLSFEKSLFKSRPPYKRLVTNASPIPAQYKYKYNYTNSVSILYTWPSFLDSELLIEKSC